MKELLDFLGWLGTADAGVLRWCLFLLGGYIAFLQRQMLKTSQSTAIFFEKFGREMVDLRMDVVRLDTWKDNHEDAEKRRHADVQESFHDVRDKIHGLALLPNVTSRNGPTR